MLVPLFGCVIFLLLYLAAAAVYPGGSQADVYAKGFSWMHNYWCNLLNEKGLNGENNAGRPFAWIAMVVLLLSLLCFWVATAKGLWESSRMKKQLLMSSGAASLLFLPLLPTGLHDAVINVSGLFGLMALFFVYYGLYKKRWYALFVFGILNLALIGLNNYLYYGTSLYWLPLVQKITFLSFLLWISMVTVKLYRHQAET